MSNKDVQASGSQSAAQAALLAELLSAAQNGNSDQCRHWANWAGQNTGNKLYSKA